MIKEMIVAAFLIACTLPALADGEKGKVQICRDLKISSITDRSPVELLAPIYLEKRIESYDGDTDQWIEIAQDIKLGAKPSCVTVEGIVTRNTQDKPAPKKGSIWKADANAKPGQWWGKKPVIKKIKIDGKYETYEESDPAKGGEIQTVALQGRALENFK
ncbi:hypothetical protein [Sideroxydans lithotrophicus]|nr:hypothetical protein [Sideroxydans lithotrophicus]